MTCQSIMTPNPPVLHPDDTVAKALDLLVANKMLAMAVVERDGRYLGMFGKHKLFGLLLPAVVAADEDVPVMAHLPDLSFLSDELDDLERRFQTVGNQTVGDHADNTVPVLHPDSPLMEALLLLFRTRNFLPVVDRKTGMLAGIVSSWDALARIRGKRS